jgi:phosphoribosylformylglycinamidine (FGAM) synthase PurS component
MNYKGKVKDSVIVLDAEIKLPEGTTVEVIVPEKLYKDKVKAVKRTGLCGIWQDERSAEEIISEIKNARTGFGNRAKL